MQEELVEWLRGQEYWKRNNGWDHVIIAGDPNALYRVVDRLWILGGRPDQGSSVKDVIIPYSHRISAYTGDFGVKERKTLLFFMGNRYRKEGGKIRDLLFQILENEKDVVIKHGTQSRENRRAASRGMHTSKFCLNPAGDPSACRLFDSIISLCVPVIVSDSIELPFEDIIDYKRFSVFVETAAALNPGYLVSLLRKVPAEKIIEYQKAMKEVKRYYDYTHPNGTVNEIWQQVSQKLPLIKLTINRDKRLVKKDLSEPNCSSLFKPDRNYQLLMITSFLVILEVHLSNGSLNVSEKIHYWTPAGPKLTRLQVYNHWSGELKPSVSPDHMEMEELISHKQSKKPNFSSLHGFRFKSTLGHFEP
ncbi:hypothetical protein CRYUN_Cryun04dG0004600 [Craigia yunnanensis]